jgi:biopolymer transport protein ExbD
MPRCVRQILERLAAAGTVLVVSIAIVGCKSEPTRNPFDTPESAPKPLPKLEAPPKPEGPPQIVIEEQGPKVGWETVLIEKDDGRERLAKAVAAVKDAYENQPVHLVVDRKARTTWVAAMLDELAKIHVGEITISTETRPEFSPKLRFLAQAQAGQPPSCALVMIIRENRSTAVWSLAGGTAATRSKGMAGPDLSTTAETIERKAKTCDTSTYFVSAAADVEWGLTYDLAASAQKVEKVKLDHPVVLSEIPTPGRPVKL